MLVGSDDDNEVRLNRLIFHHCKSMTQALKELQHKGTVLTPDLLRTLSLYRQHPSRFGTYELRDREAGPVDYDVKVGFEKHEEITL